MAPTKRGDETSDAQGASSTWARDST